MDERMQFVARRLAGEAMAELCREFGISRKRTDVERNEAVLLREHGCSTRSGCALGGMCPQLRRSPLREGGQLRVGQMRLRSRAQQSGTAQANQARLY
jgi:hypothetical protein